MSRKNNFLRFLIIWLGDFVSTIGSGLTSFALGIYVFELTKQASSTAIVVLFTFLPSFLLRPIGGVLADRIDRSFLMIVGNLGSAVGIGLIFFSMIHNHDLMAIYPGIILSSLFFALQNPAYKACVSDFLPKELYAKASGLMQLSNSAQFLIAPLLGGILMSAMSINYILLIDTFTFLFSAVAVLAIRCTLKKIDVSLNKKEECNFFIEMADGFKAITANRGIFILILLVSLLLFCVGLVQALLTPMVLSFTDTRVLGVAQSTCAIGMLASSLAISIFKRKRKNVLILSISLSLMGIFFSFIGIFANIWAIIIPGFLFFSTIPFVNSAIDVLIRQNISNEKQGRVWSLISVVTYLGAIIAYATAGFLADKIFNPLFMPDGRLVATLGQIFGVGPGRGIAFIFFISGIFVIILSAFVFKSKPIQQLDLKI